MVQTPEAALRLEIPGSIFESMIAHCVEQQPNEACGILAGRDIKVSGILRMKNVELSPASYLMDPAEQFAMLKELRRKSLSMLAIYHSHPCAPAFPSSTDIERAYYDEAVYVIVSLAEGGPVAKGYKIKEGKVTEVLVQLI